MIWEITAKYHEYFITYVSHSSSSNALFHSWKITFTVCNSFQFTAMIQIRQILLQCAMIMCNKVNELSVWSWTQNVWLCFHIRFIDLSLLSANAIIAEHHHPHVCKLPFQSRGGSMANVILCKLVFSIGLVSAGSCGVLSGEGVRGLSPTEDVCSLELG